MNVRSVPEIRADKCPAVDAESAKGRHFLAPLSFAVFVMLALSACAGNEAMQWRPKPPKKCEVIYSEPQRDYHRCITRRQLDDILGQL
jgi:hypothetical protein